VAQVEVEREGGVLIVTMNRPQRYNAMTLTMFAQMADAWQELREDDSLTCAILTGAGGNFSAGMDLRAMAGDADETGAIDTAQRLKDDPGFVWRGLLKTDRPYKPVIAAVEGYAYAGGTEILQGTDIRVASTSARFAVSEAKRSLYPMGGSAVRLRRQIPYAWAVDILVSGRDITAQEALQLGLVSHVVPEGGALAKAKEVAADVAACGPLAVEAIMQVLRETEHMSEADAFAYEQPLGNAVFASDDAKEGPLAFKEKRDPVYKRK
jgi:enoyl-CoA hydratase